MQKYTLMQENYATIESRIIETKKRITLKRYSFLGFDRYRAYPLLRSTRANPLLLSYTPNKFGNVFEIAGKYMTRSKTRILAIK